MPSRAGALAEQFEAVNAAIRDLVAGCSEQIWHMRCPGEEWPIGVVAHHIALTQPAFLNLLTILAAGEVLAPRVSIDVVHQRNARQAHDSAVVAAAETLAVLQESGGAIARLLRSLDDAQLARTTMAFGGQEMNLAQVIERVVIGHAMVHLDSMRAAITAHAGQEETEHPLDA